MAAKFNFTQYPNLKVGYKKYCALEKTFYKLSAKDSSKLLQARQELNEYATGEFARMIYETFSPQKPLLRNMDEETVCKWDDLFGKPFAEIPLDVKDYLHGLVTGDFVYLLPEKYYTE